MQIVNQNTTDPCFLSLSIHLKRQGEDKDTIKVCVLLSMLAWPLDQKKTFVPLQGSASSFPEVQGHLLTGEEVV